MNNITDIFTNPNTTNVKVVLLLTSFLGGIIAYISPCSLSMLPIVIGYIGGYGDKQVIKTAIQLISFVFCSSIIFTSIGILCAITGKAFILFGANYFKLIIAGILFVLGLNLMGILHLNIPILINKIPKSQQNSIFLYPLILGATFAIAGTPCSTPILAGIMSLASVSGNILLATIMLFLFSIGEGIILIIAGLFTSIIKNFGVLSKYSELLVKFNGLLLISIAIYFYIKIFLPFFLN